MDKKGDEKCENEAGRRSCVATIKKLSLPPGREENFQPHFHLFSLESETRQRALNDNLVCIMSCDKGIVK